MKTPALVTRLETMVRDGMQLPATRSRLAETDLDMIGATAAELATFLNQQFALWLPVAGASGATEASLQTCFMHFRRALRSREA